MEFVPDLLLDIILGGRCPALLAGRTIGCLAARSDPAELAVLLNGEVAVRRNGTPIDRIQFHKGFGWLEETAGLDGESCAHG